jgi:hypothetical protein
MLAAKKSLMSKKVALSFYAFAFNDGSIDEVTILAFHLQKDSL